MNRPHNDGDRGGINSINSRSTVQLGPLRCERQKHANEMCEHKTGSREREREREKTGASGAKDKESVKEDEEEEECVCMCVRACTCQSVWIRIRYKSRMLSCNRYKNSRTSTVEFNQGKRAEGNEYI